VLQVLSGGSYWWKFKHPTVRDAFGSLIVEDHELLDIYLLGTPVESLLREITCGDVGIQGMKVIVPRDRYDLVLRRLTELDMRKAEDKARLHHFLSFRCDKAFLEAYLRKHPLFIPWLQVWSYLSAVTDVEVFAALHKYGLLPEDQRARFVTEVKQLTVDPRCLFPS